MRLFLLLALAACQDAGPDLETECEPRPDDETGYLEPICAYIVDTFDSYPEDPNDLEIEQVVSGSEDPRGDGQYATTQYDHVFLSCCFTGDIAVMDTSTNQVVYFELGDL